MCALLLVHPVVTNLTTNKGMATSDYMVGYYIVASLNASNVTVTVDVTSDPCPTVQWSINGTNISDDSPDYSSINGTNIDDYYIYNDPCQNGSSSSSYSFTITIASLTPATSGSYSAVFSHPFGSTFLHMVITIPGMFHGI